MAGRLVAKDTPNDGFDPAVWEPIEQGGRGSPSSAPSAGAPGPSPYFAASTPAAMQLEPDTMKTQYPGSVGVRVMPPIAAGQPGVNAAVKSTTIIERSSGSSGPSLLTNGALNAVQGRLNLVGSGVSTDGYGNTTIEAGGSGSAGSIAMPLSVFSVTGDTPITLTGGAVDINFKTQPLSYFLASPPIGGVAATDATYQNLGVNTTGLSDSIAIPNANDLAIYAQINVNYPPGVDQAAWSLVVSGFESTVDAIWSQQVSAAGSAAATHTFPGNTSWVTAAAVFKTSGTPSIRQKKSLTSGSPSGTYTASFTSSVLAGSVIVVVAAYAAASSGHTSAWTVWDSLNGSYTPIAQPINYNANGTVQLAIYAVLNPTGGSPTVSFKVVNSPTNVSGNGAYMMEITGLSSASGYPYFRGISQSDLAGAIFNGAGTGASAGAVPPPPSTISSPNNGTNFYLREDTQWSQITLTTDVTGVLPVVNGGTGTATPSLVAGAGITVSGSFPNQTVTSVDGGVNSQTANYTAVSGDNGKLISFTGSTALTCTLPATPPSTTWRCWVKNNTTQNLTLSPNGKNLDGSSSSQTIAPGVGKYVTTDGTNYFSV